MAAASIRISGTRLPRFWWEAAQYELDVVGAADLIEQADEQVRTDWGCRRDGALRERRPLLIGDVGAERRKQDGFLV